MKRDLELQDDDAEPAVSVDRGGAGSGIRNRFRADPGAVIDPAHNIDLLVTGRRQAGLGTGDMRKPIDRAGSELAGRFPSRLGNRLYWPDGRVTDVHGVPL